MEYLNSIASYLPLVGGIFLLLLAIAILASGKFDRYRAHFSYFIAATAVWSGVISFFMMSNNEMVAHGLIVTYYVAALVVGYGMLLFARSIPVKDGKRRRYTFLMDFLLSLPATLTTIWIVFTDGFINKLLVTEEANLVELSLPLYLFYCAVFGGYVIAAMYIMRSKYRAAQRSSTRLLRQRLRLVAGAIIFGMSFAAVFNLILPVLGIYKFIWIGPLGIIPSVIAFWYAIIRHGLFDVRLILSRTITHFFLLTSLIGIYAVLVYAIGHFIINDSQPVIVRESVNIISAVILAFSFKPLQKLFDRLTFRLFFRHDYSVTAVQQVINKIVAEETSLEKLNRRTLDILQAVLNPLYIRLFVFREDKTYEYHHGMARLKHNVKESQVHFAQLVAVHDKVLFTQDDFIETIDSDKALISMAHEGDVDVALQLKVQGERVGLLLLGTKRNLAAYTKQDYRLLTLTGEEIALAIQNAMRLGQIEDLNQNLQHRIVEATKELRSSNRSLKALDDTKDEFISMASHQLRTPLTSVKGYLSMVLDGDLGVISPSQKQVLTEAFTSSERMVHLINDFLNVSRLQTGKFMIDQSEVNLAKMLQQEVEGLHTFAGSRQIKLEYHKPATFPLLMIDEGKLRQVVMNFIDNAVYYSLPGGTIQIELKINRGRAIVTIRDHGIGVPKAEQDQLFSKFFRATNARRQRPDGTGVGLFLAKKVIMAHHGDVVFSSEEGKGSVFGFSLPIEELRTRNDADKLDNQPDDNAKH
ncbi:MAG: putative Histidine kinase [Candidatus Saccharibacteria bacterium]|nr:putative Histidine kinase [Candidatus Saccharibacteria bacterium]